MKYALTYALFFFLIGGMGIYMFFLKKEYEDDRKKWKHAAVILISKQEMKLQVVDFKGETVFSAPICVGKNAGNKNKKGDMRTPEGVFKVSDIHNSSSWKHDFGDGKGEISGAYGPHFIRLDVPGHKGIGIHGTHLPESIGTRDSEGCIRLENSELEKLVPFVRVPMTVIITPSAEDEAINRLSNNM